MTVVNNRETNIGDEVFYTDEDKKIYDAIVRSIQEDGSVDLKVNKDGQHFDIGDVPHNTSPEKHSWNHPRSKKEVKSHYHPHFYGIPEDEE